MALFERLRSTVSQVLRVEGTPHRLAFTFALGVFVGMSPFIGIHVVIALALAWIFNLNRIAILSGVFINNPWSMIPLYTFSTWIGTLILEPDLAISDVDWRGITLGTIVSDLGSLVLPFIVGTVLVGTVTALISYMVVRKMAESARENI